VPEPDLDPRSAGYPRGLVDRPLILPSGTAEGTLALGIGLADGGIWTTRIGPSARYAIGSFELEGGAQVVLDDRHSTVFAAAQFASNPDMTVGLELVVDGPASDTRATTPRLVLGRKQLLTETVAVESNFAGGVSRSAGVTAYVASGEMRVQMQVAPLYAVQARAALNVRYLEGEGTTLGHNYGVGVLASVISTIDLFPSVDLFAADDDYLGVVVSLAVSARNR